MQIISLEDQTFRPVENNRSMRFNRRIAKPSEAGH